MGWLIAPALSVVIAIMAALLRWSINEIRKQEQAIADRETEDYLDWITEMMEVDIDLDRLYHGSNLPVEDESTSTGRVVPGRVEHNAPLLGGREG